MICPKCHSVYNANPANPPTACSRCGASLRRIATAPGTAPRPTAATGKGNRFGLYFLGCTGLLIGLMIISLLGGAGAWWYLAREVALTHTDYYGKIVVPKTQTLRYVDQYTNEGVKITPSSDTPSRISTALFDGLAEYNNENAELTPSLAATWDKNTDATVWTFHLRKNAVWSDGTPLTANDFIYSWRRLLAPGQNVFYQELFLIRNAKKFNDFKAGPDELGVRAVDDHTLEVKLEQPVPYFDKLIAISIFRPVPKHAIEKHGLNWDKPENLVTSGAFKISSWSDSEVVLVRNEKFWDAANVRLEKIVIPSFPPKDEDDTDFVFAPGRAYEQGQLDVTVKYLTDDAAYENKKDFIESPRMSVRYFYINTRIKPFTDIRVRRALNLAINREEIKAAHYGIDGTPARTLIPRIDGYDGPGDLKFDPEEAQRLLSQAGYPRGNGFPVIDILIYDTYYNQQRAEFVKNRLKKELGITAEIKSMKWSQFLRARDEGNYKGLALSGWQAFYNDPMDFLNVFRDEENPSGWSDKKFADLLARSDRETDGAERFRILKAAEEKLLTDHPIIPLTFNTSTYLTKPYVRGFAINPFGEINWRQVYIDTEFGPDSFGERAE